MIGVMGDRRQAILRLLLQNKEGWTVDQLAAQLGITRTAVREHLAGLERDRLIALAGPRASTGGRPSRPYVLTDAGHALFPKHYDLMAQLLLEEVAEREDGDVAGPLAALGEKLAARLKPSVQGDTLEARGQSVAGLMSELGYEASWKGEGEPVIEALNCVYHDLAFRNPAVCALDLALIGNLAEAEVEHRSCMARGDNACAFCLSPKRRRMDSDAQHP